VQEGFVERVRSTDRQRQSVTDQRIALAGRGKALAEAATDAKPVLRRDLHEIEGAAVAVEQRAQQGPPQTETCARRGERGAHGISAGRLAAALALAALAFLLLAFAALALTALALGLLALTA